MRKAKTISKCNTMQLIDTSSVFGLVWSVWMLPFNIFRCYVVHPIAYKTQATYEDYKLRTTQGVVTAREILFKFSIVALAAAIILWLAIFMYIAFYYTYMPAIAHIRPVHMQFEACDSSSGLCSFPQAHVLLTRKQQLLMVGQPYRVTVSIDMPESEQNIQLGMFMVCAEMRDKETKLRSHSCRSAMLHYRSSLARTITTLVMSPLIVLGFKEETQQIPVELFANYEDDFDNPVTDVFVEIQTRQIQFYSVTLQITAHFSGLRYIMFHWPVLSAAIGIGANLFFILTVSLLSWYHWSESVWMEDAQKKIRARAKEIRLKRSSVLRSGHDTRSDLSSLSTSNDESNRSFNEDDEDISIIDKALLSRDEADDIEELSGLSGGELRQRKPQKSVVDISCGTEDEHDLESTC